MPARWPANSQKLDGELHAAAAEAKQLVQQLKLAEGREEELKSRLEDTK